MENSTEYVLRLLIVKLEDVLLDLPNAWESTLCRDTKDSVDVDTLFPAWADTLCMDESSLRNRLEDYALEDQLEIRQPIYDLLNTVRNHTPMRAAVLSTGPKEWVDTLKKRFDLEAVTDLCYHYDRYRHGDRDTLLMFLMNRFIAGKGRTLFLGSTLADERMSEREETRFKSLRSPPEKAENPENWNYTMDKLESFIMGKKADD